MKRTVTLLVWISSLIMMTTLIESLDTMFWISFIAFVSSSIYLKKHTNEFLGQIKNIEQ